MNTLSYSDTGTRSCIVNLVDAVACCGNDTPACNQRKTKVADFLDSLLCFKIYCSHSVAIIPCFWPIIIFLVIGLIAYLITKLV